MMAKGRSKYAINLGIKFPKGTSHPSVKLSEEDVLTIRSEYKWWKTTGWQLAHRFGVRQSTIQRIVKRLTWKHI
jgi:hypothetical protein